MCAYSVVVDGYRNVPLQDWNNNNWGTLQEILQKVKDLDTKLGQKDCEDPSKQAWMRLVEKRLKKLEKE